MRLRTLSLALAVGGALAACDGAAGYRDYPATTSAYGTRSGYDRGYSGSARRDERYGATSCNPSSATTGGQATILHQDRPGGTDCTPSSARNSRGLY
ncbi:MAG TPA: hypothetical protein VGD08_01020 [Stellaceae bacterium]